jgi:hypothetical protein
LVSINSEENTRRRLLVRIFPNTCIGEREVACFVILCMETRSFRNIDLIQYCWKIYDFSINEFGEEKCRTYCNLSFNSYVEEQEISYFLKINPAPTAFRNINLTQYNWVIHKVSINKFRKVIRRTYRGPIFNICVGEREIAYFVKNSQKSPDLH